MMPLIMLVGKAGVGKDTTAAIMKEFGASCIALADPLKELARDCLGFTQEQLWGASERRNIPDTRPLGEMIDYWNNSRKKKIDWLMRAGIWSDYNYQMLNSWFVREVRLADLGTVTPRLVLQTLGTMGRNIDPKIWVNYAQKRVQELLEDPERKCQFVVITDGRYTNEVLSTKRNGGYIVRVDGQVKTAPDNASHSSETEQGSIPDSWFDYVIVNDKAMGLQHLRDQVTTVLNRTVLEAPVTVF